MEFYIFMKQTRSLCRNAFSKEKAKLLLFALTIIQNINFSFKKYMEFYIFMKQTRSLVQKCIF